MSLINTPLSRKNIQLKNRLVMEACGTSNADTNGHVTDKSIEWYSTRCRGFGLSILEHAYVSEWGKAAPNMLSICDDACIPGLSRLIDSIHEQDCKAWIQLDHGAGWTIPQLRSCLDEKANPELKRVTDEITDEQLDNVIPDFASAALRAQKCGFDGIEIKACHVYLLSQFYSPLTNKRTAGKYAGTSFETRSRLIIDILDAIRHKVDPGFCIAVRIPISDYSPGGITVDESLQLAHILEEHGADVLDISGGVKYRYIHPDKNGPGYFSNEAKLVKEVSALPTILTGGITTGSEAEELLKQNSADLIGVCRAWMKNPEWGIQNIH